MLDKDVILTDSHRCSQFEARTLHDLANRHKEDLCSGSVSEADALLTHLFQAAQVELALTRRHIQEFLAQNVPRLVPRNAKQKLSAKLGTSARACSACAVINC